MKKKRVRGLEWRQNEWREESKGEKRRVNKKSWETPNFYAKPNDIKHTYVF